MSTTLIWGIAEGEKPASYETYFPLLELHRAHVALLQYCLLIFSAAVAQGPLAALHDICHHGATSCVLPGVQTRRAPGSGRGFPSICDSQV